MKMDRNVNKSVIRRLANKSMENSRTRNLFTCLTIALSVALVLTFILYVFGSSKEKLRLLEDSPQVSYMDITPEQAEQLKTDERVKWAAADSKAGSGKVGNNRLLVMYQDETFMERDQIEYTGELPEEDHDIMLPADYIEQLGLSVQPGDTVSLDLGNKKVREYRVTAIVDTPSKAKNSHKIYVSLPCAMMLKGESVPTVSASVNMKGAMDMDLGTARQRALKIGEAAGIPEGQIKVNDGYFGQAGVSRLTTGSIITLVLVALLILAAAGLVIHNIFYIAVAGKVREYGQMRTLGMTRQQVRTLVSREGMILALKGMPFGILLGGVMGYALVPKGWDTFTFLGAALVCLLLGMVSVGIAVRKPAKIAAATSPIEALGYTGYTEKMKESTVLKRRLTPNSLAGINLKRNRKKSILTMSSLVLAGVLLGTIATFIVSYDPGASADNFFPEGEYQLQLTAESGYDNNDTSLEGRVKAYAQLQAEDVMGEGLKEELESIDGVISAKPWKYLTIAANMFGEEQQEGVNGFTEADFALLKEMDYDGPETYDELLDAPGMVVETESNSNFKEHPIKRGDTISVVYYNQTDERIEENVPVLATIKMISWNKKNVEEGRDVRLPLSVMGSTLLMPAKMLDQWTTMNTTYGYEIAVEPEAEKAVGRELDKLFGAEENMYLSSKTETREYLENESFAMKMILYVLAVFLVAFGVINLMNTIMTNLFTRKKELGILQAVGMTKEQIRTMLSRETLSYVGVSAICTLVFGGVLGYGLVRACIQLGLGVSYTFPWIPVLLYIVLLAAMQLIMTQYGVKMLQKETLVERMKETD